MDEKEGDEVLIYKDENEPDFSSLNKYFKEDSEIGDVNPVKVRTITEDISISESSFTSYGNKEVETQIVNKEVEKEFVKGSGKVTNAKKEFLKSLEDESLTVDTCSNVNRDWNRK